LQTKDIFLVIFFKITRMICSFDATYVSILIFNFKNLNMATITDIEGIGPALGDKFKATGISTVEKLLSEGASKKGRATLAETTGISEGKILDFVNMADLFRIKGVAGQFAELLKASGVDTVKELRTRNAENLRAKLIEVNEEKNLTNAVPALSRVEDFISQAKELEPVVTY